MLRLLAFLLLLFTAWYVQCTKSYFYLVMLHKIRYSISTPIIKAQPEILYFSGDKSMATQKTWASSAE